MLSHFNFVIEHIYLSGFMKTWLQCGSKGRSYAKCVLGTKTLTHLPLSSAIIMIIIHSRGLIQLARAN